MIGISKQAVHQHAHRLTHFDLRIDELILNAENLRRAHPGCGVEKMYYVLKPDFIGQSDAAFPYHDIASGKYTGGAEGYGHVVFYGCDGYQQRRFYHNGQCIDVEIR